MEEDMDMDGLNCFTLEGDARGDSTEDRQRRDRKERRERNAKREEQAACARDEREARETSGKMSTINPFICVPVYRASGTCLELGNPEGYVSVATKGVGSENVPCQHVCSRRRGPRVRGHHMSG